MWNLTKGKKKKKVFLKQKQKKYVNPSSQFIQRYKRVHAHVASNTS